VIPFNEGRDFVRIDFFCYTSELLQFIVSCFQTLRSRNLKYMLRDSDFSVSHFNTLDAGGTFEAVAWRI